MTVFGDCILYPAQSKCIWRVSLLFLLSSSYALYRGHYALALVPGGVLMTSLNYWRKPTYGWRRNLDITFVWSALIYQNIRAYRMSNAVPYYHLMIFGASLYPISNYLHKKKYYWSSTYVHCMLHIVANISNMVLYSGDGDGDSGGNDGGNDGGNVGRDIGICSPPFWSAAAFCPFSYPCFFRGHIVSPIRCYGVS